jgi:hypothetical protein
MRLTNRTRDELLELGGGRERWLKKEYIAAQRLR